MRNQPSFLCMVVLACASTSPVDAQPAAAPTDALPEWSSARQVLVAFCADCHQGESAEANLDLNRFETPTQVVADPIAWQKIVRRVRDHQMPPEGSEQPTVEQREAIALWVERTLQQAACGDGIQPGPARLRRLNRSEYAATIRDLLEIHVDTSHVLPSDGAGGEGFDNAAETLFISPIHAEKYLEAARTALDHAFRDPRARGRVLVAMPELPPEFVDAGTDARAKSAASADPVDDQPGTSAERQAKDQTSDQVVAADAATVDPVAEKIAEEQVAVERAAETTLRAFLPRAFRRPVSDDEVATYLELFRTLYHEDRAYELALRGTLEAVLISPHFLFHIERPPRTIEAEQLSDFELANRLSYFLWGSMPDEELMQAAREGKLNDDEQLTAQVRRMLGTGDDRSARRAQEKVRDFSQSFVEQWLGTRALGREFKPDPSVAGRYDSELEGGMKYEPVFFFQELLSQNLSLLNLIDSDFTYANRRLARHYRIPGEFREQPRRTDLPEDSRRGGLLGMASVLAVSSYPHRTSPVLRGKWVLETLLGDPPPPPPPNVPELAENDKEGESPRTLRERLELHRQNATCASCHSRIDPLGFGLENYDVLGRWRDELDGQPIDSRGRLPNGTEFAGPEELKQVLLDRKEQVIRHLTSKLLGYALGRGLTLEDACSVDQIVRDLAADDYRAQTLVVGIVRSVPFRYKQAAVASDGGE